MNPRKSVIADEIGAVQFVVANARFTFISRVRLCAGGNQSAEFAHDFANVHIEQPVFDVVRTHGLIGWRNGQFQAGFRARHFILHGLQRVILVRRSLVGRENRRRHDTEQAKIAAIRSERITEGLPTLRCHARAAAESAAGPWKFAFSVLPIPK